MFIPVNRLVNRYTTNTHQGKDMNANPPKCSISLNTLHFQIGTNKNFKSVRVPYGFQCSNTVNKTGVGGRAGG